MRLASLIGVACAVSGSLLLSVGAWGAPESTDSPTGSLEIVVVDDVTGVAVPYANVVLADSPGGWLAGGDGVCRVHSAPVGALRVRVVHISYRSSETELVVHEGETSRVEVRLVSRDHELPTVTVTADRPIDLRSETGGARTLQADDATPLPNPTDDAFQMVHVLPGVTSGDVGSDFRMRGGGIDETLVRIDGLEVRELFHGRDFGGITGIIPFGVVDRMDVYAGGFPARYGGRTSGVVELGLRETGETGFHGRVAADMASARALVERHGPGGSLLVSVRQGYLDRVMEKVQSEAIVEPAYRDVLLRGVIRTGRSGSVTVNALLSEDRALYEDGVDAHFINASYLDRYAWSTWRAHDGPGATRLSAWVAESRQRRLLADDLQEKLVGLRLGASGELGLELGPHRVTAGGQLERHDGEYRFVSRDVVLIDEDGQTSLVDSLDTSGNYERWQTSAFVQDEWKLGRLAINAGLRFEHDSEFGTGPLYLRASAAFGLTSSTVLRGAWGRYGQFPDMDLTGPTELQILSERMQEAEHVVLGIEQRLGGVRFGADAYEKTFPVLDGVVTRTLRGEVERRLIRDGASRGVELWLRRAGTASHWWLAYSLGSSKWSDGEHTYSRDFDQLHTLAIANTWQLGRHWDVGVSYRFHSGLPYTSQRWRQGDGTEWVLTEGTPNAQRLPDYHRVDLRVRRWFRFDGWEMSVYADALNLTNHDNVLWYAWRFRDDDGTRKPDPERITRTGVPGIPSLGLEVRW